jgi:NTE family protein
LIPAPTTIPATIALVPIAAARALPEVRDGLLSGLRRAGAVAWIEEPEEGDASVYGPLLDRLEHEHRQVLLAAGSPKDAGIWTQFCLRQADRVALLADVAEEVPEWLEQHPTLQGCDLLIRQPTADGPAIERWVAALNPRTTHALRDGSNFAADLERAGRRLAGRSVGIVLSGGGARGLAHIGVRRAAGLGGEIDRVGGCSMGAYVGGMVALEQEPREIRSRCREEFVLRNPLSDYTVPALSLVRGNRAMAMLARTFGQRTIESAPRAYFSVSCDLLSGELVVHDRGSLVESVAASMCVPGVLAPRSSGDRLLVDGGVLNNLPVMQMAAAGKVRSLLSTSPPTFTRRTNLRSGDGRGQGNGHHGLGTRCSVWIRPFPT